MPTPYSSLSPAERRAICAAAGRCDICGRADLPLALDHNHDTDAVRGVLCRDCNLTVVWHIERGAFPAWPDGILLAALDYLDAGGWQQFVQLPSGRRVPAGSAG